MMLLTILCYNIIIFKLFNNTEEMIMSFNIKNLENSNRQVSTRLKNFSIIEHSRDLSVAPENAIYQYFMSEMNVKRRQLVVEMNNDNIIVQAGAMQWTTGNISASTGVKGMGDFLGKMAKSAVTKESAIKPEYVGTGLLVLEPTYKYLILQEISDWGFQGMVIEDGMFLACSSGVEQKIQARSKVSSAIAGGEGLFNLKLQGSGIVALESNIPLNELIEIELKDDVIKIDGKMAVAWSGSLEFSVERSGKSLIGSAASGEGLVNVYRGTGKVLMSPVAPSSSLFAATHSLK